MKNSKKIFLSLLVLLMSLIFIPSFAKAKTTDVTNQESLISAIEDAKDGDVIRLSTDIKLTKPVSVTGKTITIDGNGGSISKAEEGWTSEGPNGSLITAGGEGTKLTLKNITLKNAQKYGAQAYNGGHLVLDGVTATNNGFGGILINAGTVEVVRLHLGQNGQFENNGIEIGKGDATGDEVPELIMNGTISSEKTENVIYIAQNNEKLTDFKVDNTEDSVNKILIEGNKVVVTDKENKILFESNESSKVDLAGDDYVEPSDPSTQEPTTDPSTQNPTNDPSTQNPANDPSTQNPATDPSTQNPTNDPSTQNPTNDPSTQNTTTNPSTQNPNNTQEQPKTTTTKDVTPKTGSINVLEILVLMLSISIATIAILKNKKEL